MFSSIENEKEDFTQVTKIKVIGVGGGGNNAVERMILNGVSGVEFININTDAQVLRTSRADKKILIGKSITGGLGAGTDPNVGKAAALENIDDIRSVISGADMVFITTGMGGGTGSGAAPVVAKACKEEGCLTVGVVTKPFTYEGEEKIAVADAAIEEMKKYVDAIIVIKNDRLLQLTGRETPFVESFRTADNVLRQAVQGITEIISTQAIINVDFADVRTVLKNQGTAIMGIGYASGSTKTYDAAQAAIKSPLLETSIFGARRAIVNITSDKKLSLIETQEIVDEIRKASGTNFNEKFKWGCAINPLLEDTVIVTVIAAGFQGDPLKDMPIDRLQPIDQEELEMVDTKSNKNKKPGKNKEDDDSSVNIPSWLTRR